MATKYTNFHSNGPQKCNACIKEDIFEEPTSILKQGCVSVQINLNKMFVLAAKLDQVTSTAIT